MKTLHYSIIVIFGIGIIVLAYPQNVYAPCPQEPGFNCSNYPESERFDNPPIIDLKIFPSEVRVGSTFNVTATLVNNSQNPILVDANPPCENTVILDSHVMVDTKTSVGCYDVFIKHIIDPGENFTVSYPDYGMNFRAISTGTTNATVTLSYFEGNQTVHSITISKSIQFLIHDRTLQEQLDLARIQTEKRQQEEEQTKNTTDAIILASVGMPMAAGVSVGVLLFARKRK
ncbi:MAG TPA: hypothetical protein VFJ23_01540 [Candidatus Nitrosotalea sp.]|nr:hypothetical protein [Candidatus Nitrosotalea sp.]